MKKGIISILIVLLLVLVYFVLARSINIGFLKVESIKDIKEASNKLNDEMSKAQTISEQTYPRAATSLDEAIQELKTSKQEYNQKIANTGGNIQVGAVEVKTYKIHYLWTVLGNYGKDNILTLDLKSTQSKDIYDLQFTVQGKYNSISDFISNIENDDNLSFEIDNFLMEPYTTKKELTITDGDTNQKIAEVKTNPYEKIVKLVTTALGGNKTTNNNTQTQENTSTQTDSENNNTSTQTNSENNSNSTKTTTTTPKNESGSITTTIYDPKWVQATFTVKNVGIELD